MREYILPMTNLYPWLLFFITIIQSWDSFDDDYDDEQTDAVKTTPLPPNQFSQEDDDDDEEPPLPPDDFPLDLTPINHSQMTSKNSHAILIPTLPSF